MIEAMLENIGNNLDYFEKGMYVVLAVAFLIPTLYYSIKERHAQSRKDLERKTI